MGLARHGTGPIAVLRAYLAKVHPVFMLPPLAAAAFGAILADTFAPLPASVHLLAIFGAMYTAHLKDGYVDFHVRGEDDDCPLTGRGCWVGIAGAAAVTGLSLVALARVVDPWAAALTLPCWLIGYFHAPQLDTHPVTTTSGYPVGIGLAILGGYYVQAETLALEPVLMAAVFVVLLAGVKIIDDLQDFAWDRRHDKRSAGVALGIDRAHRVALGLMVAAIAGVFAMATLGAIPAASAFAAAVFAPVLYVASRREPVVQTMLLIRGSYLFLAVLIAAAWWRPLA